MRRFGALVLFIAPSIFSIAGCRGFGRCKALCIGALGFEVLECRVLVWGVGVKTGGLSPKP